MRFKQLVKEICAREGLKKQVDVAQVSELLGHLADIAYEDYVNCERLMINADSVYNDLFLIGLKRSKKKKK